jgi:hypothetical protein
MTNPTQVLLTFIYTLQDLNDKIRPKPKCQNPRYQNTRCLKPYFNLTHIFWASPVCLPFLLVRCSKSSNNGFFHFLSCPQSIFLVDMSSSISSSNGFLFRNLLHLFFSFSYFDPTIVTVSPTKFTFYLFFLVLHFLP